MQAHFKSYTCTQCNQEISSNETLRSHMFRMHSISRMFMCRCCNWAFPDKTSLHIHMQSMLRNGTPGEVAVLARSSTEDGSSDSGEACSFSPEQLQHKLLGNNNSSKIMNNNLGSIFPSTLKQENLLQFMQKDNVLGGLDVSTLSSNQWLSAWLANNPFAPNLGLGMSATGSKNSGTHDDDDMKEDHESDMDDDVLEIETTEEDLKEEEMAAISPRSTMKEGGDEEKIDMKGSLKRKATRPIQMTKTDEPENAPESLLNVTLDEKECLAEQLSPTVSDSHTSGTSSHRGDSPRKCFDCQVTKGQLLLSEAKSRQYESKIAQLEARILELQKDRITEKPEYLLPTASAHPLPLFSPVPSQQLLMQNLQNPAMKMLFHNMLANLNRQPC